MNAETKRLSLHLIRMDHMMTDHRLQIVFVSSMVRAHYSRLQENSLNICAVVLMMEKDAVS
jgi:hypothetical protein